MYMPAPGKLWLEKGGVFVLANIRGGAEFGMNWHRSAILENKQKSYDDFIAVAEDLISRKYTTSERLGIRGGSNGGLLMGAVTTQRPDLFKAVLCEVPLLDMIRYVELPPGASWMDEYGDPRNEKMREVILKYSPYQNVHKEKKYPKIFFHTSITDDRVHPSHARRMAAKMLEQGHELFFYEESEGGHGSGDLKTKAFAEAMSFSYLWMMLG
jgi:prolyl oligopeptidase